MLLCTIQHLSEIRNVWKDKFHTHTTGIQFSLKTLSTSASFQKSSSCIQLFSPNYTLPSVSCCRRKGPCTHLETLQNAQEHPLSGLLIHGGRSWDEWMGPCEAKGFIFKGEKNNKYSSTSSFEGFSKISFCQHYRYHELLFMAWSEQQLIALSFTNTFKLVLNHSAIICKWGSSRGQVSVINLPISMYYLNASILFAKSSSL